MRRMVIALALAAVMVLSAASVAVAGGPTCENFAGTTGWKNHGEHVTSGYATPGEPGGAEGGPAHFGAHPIGATPGATFCGPGNNQAPQLLGEPGRFAR